MKKIKLPLLVFESRLASHVSEACRNRFNYVDEVGRAVGYIPKLQMSHNVLPHKMPS